MLFITNQYITSSRVRSKVKLYFLGTSYTSFGRSTFSFTNVDLAGIQDFQDTYLECPKLLSLNVRWPPKSHSLVIKDYKF